MNLKELQAMIKEELDAYVNEQEVDVDVDSDDVDAGAEDMLRKIYDMLKDKFEAEEEMDDMEDVEADEDMSEEADLEENSTTDAKFQKTGMAPMSKGSAGANVGFDTAKTTKGSTGYDAGSKALQERFQKLANIIK